MSSEKYIEFSLFNQENINSSPILIESKSGIDQSVKSLSLGSTSFIQVCSTCSLTDLCPGHYGKFVIDKPIFKVIFKKEIEFLLKNICPKCGLIKNGQIIKLLEEINNNDNIITDNHRKQFNLILLENKQYNKQTKTKCKNEICQSVTTSIQYNSKNNYFTYNTNIKEICDMKNLYTYFKMLPRIFLNLLNNNNKNNIFEPKNVFYNEYLLIPSNYIRQPNIYKDISFDPFTTELNALIKIAKKSNFIESKKIQSMFDAIDNNQGDNPYSGNKKKLNLSILTNGNNKDSYLRSNINGKRVIGTGRAVISPSNILKIGEIEIPEYILNNLRENIFYNKITEKYILDSITSNKSEFTDYIKLNLSKINIYSIISLSNNYKILAPKYGDQFEKKVQKNQYIMFGRQPSIHPWNSQAGEIKKDINNYPDKFERTINIPTPIAPSQNADYDGDEILIKKFNNATSNIELGLIMNSKKLLKHPVTGTTMFGLVQDQIVGFNMLLQEKVIPYNKACLIYGQHIYLLEEIKENYTGRDIISYIFPQYFTYENTFDNGRIIVKHITSSMVSSNSYVSIFNELSHIYGEDYVISIIDIIKEIIQNYIKYYGLSILFTNLVPNIELLQEIKDFVSDVVGKANSKINDLINDLNDDKFHISSYNDVIEIKVKNINVINEKTQKFMEYILKKYYNQDDNLFVLCYNMGYKVSITDLINILCFVGQKTNKTMPYPKVNGKTYLYDLQNNINLESSGFITNSYITGLTYSQYVILVKEESLPQIVNVTSGTSQAGSAGKKMLRIASELILNYDKFIVSCKNIINFNPNFLKISVSDIVKVNLIIPNKKFIWYDVIKSLFDKNIRQYLYQNKSKSIVIKKQVSFYINIKSEILMYYYKFINETQNKKNIVNHDKNFTKIHDFYTYINNKYYFNLNELSYILYIFLTYFDPSGYVFNIKNISSYFTDELLDIIFNKILYKLNYSLSPGFMFGYYIGNTLQERFTQQTLSSFHSTTKGGGNVQKGATEEFKQLLELSKKDEDIIVCNSYDYNIINNIKNQLEHISFKIICNNIKLIEENEKYYVYCCDISLENLLQKGIDIITLYKMVKTYCNKCFSILEYCIYFKISDNIKLYINVIFNTNIKNVSINKNILKLYFKVSLWDGIHKGKQINTNLLIESIPVSKLNNDDVIENKTMYSIKFFIETVNDLKNIDTSLLDNIYITPWMSYNIGGIHYMKINTLGKVENLINDDNFIHCLKHFFDIRFGTNKPMNIKSLYNKEEIIKQANHGISNIIAHAAFKNLSDPCNDIYSSLLVSQTPNIGTNYYNFYINPNLFDPYKYITKIKFIKDEKIISIL